MQDLISRYQQLYSGIVCDALQFDFGQAPFALAPGIEQLAGPQDTPVVGPAFTCGGETHYPDTIDEEYSKRCDRIRLDALGAIQEGDVVVVAANGRSHIATFGDITASLAQRAGAVGAVHDGYTRDLAAIIGLGFPLFARGTVPCDSYGQWWITRYQVPVKAFNASGECGTVEPGDLIFADRDGVVVVPHAQQHDVLECAERRAGIEAQMRREIASGKTIASMYEELGRW